VGTDVVGGTGSENVSPELLTEAEIQAFIDSVYEWPDDEYSQ
jgi:hypothetical protein